MGMDETKPAEASVEFVALLTFLAVAATKPCSPTK